MFLAFYVGFGILAGIWPLHTWSPDGHASAPTAVSMLHAGVLMKLGAYGVVRLGMGLLPDGTHQWAWLVGAIACVNIVYGALSAMAQIDLKYVIAYSSVSHMGVVMLGAATLTEPGLNGSVFQMFAHGIMTGLFFALVGLVYEKAHSREIFKMGGFGRMMPGIATAFTIGGLSSLGLPATAGFVAEFLTFLGAWQSRIPGGCSPAVLGAFLTSIYVLRVAKQIFWGPPSPDPHFHDLPDAQGPEWAALGHPGRRRWCCSGWCRASRSAPSTPPPCRSSTASGCSSERPSSARPLALELGLAVLMLVVFFAGLFGRRDDPRRVGGAHRGRARHRCSASRGGPSRAARCFGGASCRTSSRSSPSGCSSLATVHRGARLARAPRRRPSRAGPPSTTWPILASLLGMLVLASARELILLFVAFELMSIPLYVLPASSSGSRRRWRRRSSSSWSARCRPR